MFYKKRIEELENKIDNLELELWKIKNPPKFKVGDKVKFNNYGLINRRGIISKMEINKNNFNFPYRKYFIFDLDLNKLVIAFPNNIKLYND